MRSPTTSKELERTLAWGNSVCTITRGLRGSVTSTGISTSYLRACPGRAAGFAVGIADTEPSERFPLFTRANADEVGPDPFTPLNWTLTWEQGVVPGTADAWIALGTFEPDEFVWTAPETYGSWGGYFYNQVSLGRVFGYRMPGATPDAIDISFFGQNPTVPPYQHDPRDDNEACSAKLGESFGAILGGAIAAGYVASKKLPGPAAEPPEKPPSAEV